ncbi:lactonase family protein [Erysipelothrix urinaevulpis]|uniref:lactonase family protein n=1 Tax=Erysipelothrix urinaevulpis TaxID=2683717 RepID=UPI00135B2EA3|nr:lactonase family protein [Erysipelothrix urinaevulpis]
MKILLGAYTRNDSEGLYQIDLNETDQTLENLELLIKAENPTYLDYDKTNNTLYSVYQEGNLGGIGAYTFTEEGNLEKKYAITEEGTPPCYVKYDSQSGKIYDANYHHGKMNIYQNQTHIKTVQYEEGAHAHYTDFDPKTNVLYVCDLGNDKVYKYQNDEQIASIRLEEGSGPRHIAFHPTLDRLYVFAELNNTVTVLDSDFNIYQIITSLEHETNQSAGAAIRISNDGKFLYASNRGEDSLVVYAIDESGQLSIIQHISTFGEHPRDFDLSPDGQFLVVANRDTNNLSLYTRDQLTGLLTNVQKDIHAPEAVCVYFLDK